MTHDGQCTAFESMIQLLADEGFEGMAEAIAILVNEAIKIERAEALNAEPYERTAARRGYAKGSGGAKGRRRNDYTMRLTTLILD